MTKRMIVIKFYSFYEITNDETQERTLRVHRMNSDLASPSPNLELPMTLSFKEEIAKYMLEARNEAKAKFIELDDINDLTSDPVWLSKARIVRYSEDGALPEFES